MIRIDRKSGPPLTSSFVLLRRTGGLIRLWHEFCLYLRQKLTRDFEIVDIDSRFRLRCETGRELGRCYNFFLKEPVKPGDIFYDIGANIGVFTILAASRTGEKGKILAFEPHSASFTRLIDNIALNNFQHIVVPCNFALNDKDGYFPFNYFSGEAGTSDSQLLSERNFSDIDYPSGVFELKYAASVDSLIASGNFSIPHHIKIDVDGNELAILRGMTNLLKSAEHPRSLQVEIHKDREAEIMSFMENHKFHLIDKHYSRGVQRRIAKGANPDDLHYNAIFMQNA